MSIEAMKQALEVLEQINKLSIGENAIALPGEIDAAMDNLRAAIEQAPVAWMYDFLSDNEVIRDWVTQSQEDIARENGFNVRPLYTAPRQEQYDQTALELCDECGWKAIIPGEGCLTCARQKPKYRRGTYVRCMESDELCRVWTTSIDGGAWVKWPDGSITTYTAEQMGQAFSLEQAAPGKPVAYVDERIHGWPDCFVMEPDPPHTVPLYTEPQEWVELTDDEARALINRATFGDRTNWQALVYMIDAKLKEKNT